MIALVCRSAMLAAELKSIIGSTDTVSFGSGDEESVARSEKWLLDLIRRDPVSLVIFEPDFFVDPSRFRLASPKTRFIVLASPGEEDNARKALVCGASAVIDKPLVAQDVRGVLALVLQ